MVVRDREDSAERTRASWRALFNLRECRLCRRVTLTVLIAILLVEAAVLIPSAIRYERQLLIQREQVALAGFFGAVDALAPSIDARTGAAAVAEAAGRAMAHAPLTGGVVETPDGERILFGAVSDPAIDAAGLWLDERRRYSVVWTPEAHGAPFRVVALLDVSDLPREERNYVLRVAGLVLIITAVVTAATLAVVNLLVLRRLVGLQRALTTAADDPEHPERYVVDASGDDELSSVSSTANALLRRVGGQIVELNRARATLEQMNEGLEARVAERTAALAKAEAEARVLARFPEENPDPVLRIDAGGRLVYANPHGRAVLESIGLSAGDPAPEAWMDIVRAALAGAGDREEIVRCSQRAYSFRFAPVPELGYVNAYGRDVTAQQRAEERAHRASTRDPLTDLPNRALFMHRFGQAIAHARRARDGGSILMIGLKNFSAVNDALGFDGGDQVLIETAARLRAVARSEDDLARIGGDEFAIIAPGLRDVGAAANLGARIAEALAPPVATAAGETDVHAAIGVASFDPRVEEASADELMRQAGLAMFRAKASAGTAVAFFDPDRDEEARRARAMTRALRAALEDGRFELHYQPKLRLSDGAVVGVEALIRMRDPAGALVPPGAFIPAAERSGLITPMGRWALFESARASMRLLDTLGFAPQVAVNLSAVQLAEDDAPALVAAVLAETGLPADLLELEVTESAVIGDMDHAVAALDAVAALGVSIAIDDFGTGQSSLSYLRRLPARKMKLDRSFVVDIETDAEAATVARAVVGLGRGLEMKTVAEGVETEGQMNRLRVIGVDEVQGYLFSRPLPEGDLVTLLRTGKPFLGAFDQAA